MENLVLYFTGTGNSLAVAKRVAAAVPNTRLLSIVQARQQGLKTIQADRLGIVFPVYAGGIPLLLQEFLDDLQNVTADFRFALATCGGGALGALTFVARALQAKGAPLQMARNFTMPGNFIPLYGGPTQEKEKIILSVCDKKLDAAISLIQNREPSFHRRFNAVLYTITYPGYWLFSQNCRTADRKFRVESHCTSCGLCAKVCPANNIALDAAGRPVWKNSCEQCYGCLNLCPVQAIEFGWFTKGRRRYKHPDITSQEIADQKQV